MRRRFTWPSTSEGLGGDNDRLRACVCCLADYIPAARTEKPHRSYCARRLSGKCRKCTSRIRFERLQLDPTANLLGRPRGPRMPCGWNCGARLTAGELRKHFAGCPLRPIVQHASRQLLRKPNLRGRPPGARMPCGWQCGASFTATEMRTHFVDCALRPKSSRQSARNGAPS